MWINNVKANTDFSTNPVLVIYFTNCNSHPSNSNVFFNFLFDYDEACKHKILLPDGSTKYVVKIKSIKSMNS